MADELVSLSQSRQNQNQFLNEQTGFDITTSDDGVTVLQPPVVGTDSRGREFGISQSNTAEINRKLSEIERIRNRAESEGRLSLTSIEQARINKLQGEVVETFEKGVEDAQDAIEESNELIREAEDGDDEAKDAAEAAARGYSPNPITISDNSELTVEDVGDIEIDVLDNPFTHLSQGTYHWSFYMVNPLILNKKGNELTQALEALDSFNLSNGDNVSNSSSLDKIIIAETGSSIFNIQSVEFDTAIGPNFDTKNASQLVFTMKIQEAGALAFADAVLQSGRVLMANPMKAPFILELRFHGYDETGKYVQFDEKYALNKEPSPKVWRWRVVIQNITSDYGVGGASHELKIIPFSSNALQPTANEMISPFEPPQSGTVGQFLDALSLHLAEESRRKYFVDRHTWVFLGPDPSMDDNGNPSDPFNGYSLSMTNTTVNIPGFGKVGPIGGWTYDSDGLQSAYRKYHGMSESDQDSSKISFTKSDTIQSMIDIAISSTKQANEINAELSKHPDLKEYSILNWVTTDTLIDEGKPYDYFWGDYNKFYYYFIHPYIDKKVMKNREQADELKRKDKMLRKVKSIVEERRIRKVYDYFYTGLNTEVENFDVKFETAWLSTMPMFSATTGSNTVAGGTNIDPDVGDRQALETPMQQALKYQSEADSIRQLSTTLRNLGVGTDDVDTDAAREVISNNRREFTRIIQESNPDLSEDDINSLFDDAGSSSTFELNAFSSGDSEKQSEILRLLNEAEQNTIERGREAISEVDQDLQQKAQERNESLSSALSNELNKDAMFGGPLYAEMLLTDEIRDLIDEHFIMTFEQRIGTEHNQGNTGAVRGPEKSLYAAIADMAYIGKEKYLIRIDVDVKGDPFWIGTTNTSSFNDWRDDPQKSSIDSEVPYYNSGGHFMLFRFNLPDTIDPETGWPQLKRSNTFTGLYQLIKVKHLFEGGRYKQTLNAALSPALAIKDLKFNLNYNDDNPNDNNLQPQQ